MADSISHSKILSVTATYRYLRRLAKVVKKDAEFISSRKYSKITLSAEQPSMKTNRTYQKRSSQLKT